MALKRAYDKTGDIRAALEGRTPYEDITAALDYYFENYNNGRPFIIASHSQGSAINSLVMKSYFKEHPDYYKRMIASYMIGFSLTKDWLKDNPHLKCRDFLARFSRELALVDIYNDSDVLPAWHLL